MKKSFLIIVCTLLLFVVSGCGKNDGSFSIVCEGTDNLMEGVKTTNKSVYNFDKEQYLADYEVTSISVYDDEETYKIYKEGAEETANSNDDSSLVYTVKTDDETKTVNFSYKMTFTKEMYNEVENKEFYKAANVLERAESNSNAKCTLKNIKREQIK